MEMRIRVKMLLANRGMTITSVAKQMNPPTTQQNLSAKIRRNSLTEKDLKEIARVCGATYESYFLIDDGTKI